MKKVYCKECHNVIEDAIYYGEGDYWHKECSPEEINRIADIISKVLDDSNQLVCILMAIQIIKAGNIEAHAKTMSDDSEWVQIIFPKIREEMEKGRLEYVNSKSKNSSGS